MSTYVLRGGSAASERLSVLAQASWPTTERLLNQVGVARGWRVLDVGCGNGHVAIKLAALVAPTGTAVGADSDGGVLEVARADAQRAGCNVDFVQRSVLDLNENDTYDLVYARFLLTHLSDPRAGLESMIRAARPGGRVVTEDIDFHSCFCWPPNEAFYRYASLYTQVAMRRGADPIIGPKLVGMFLDAGLQDVRFEAVEPLFREGVGKIIPQLTVEHIRESLVGAGLATDAEIDTVIGELDRFRLDPNSIMGYPRVFQVWGRKPLS